MVEQRTEALLTASEMAKLLKVTRKRVCYVLDTRGVVPRVIAGATRLFGLPELAFVRSELARIARERGG